MKKYNDNLLFYKIYSKSRILMYIYIVRIIFSTKNIIIIKEFIYYLLLFMIMIGCRIN